MADKRGSEPRNKRRHNCAYKPRFRLKSLMRKWVECAPSVKWLATCSKAEVYSWLEQKFLS